jgi:hypothetical protein
MRLVQTCKEILYFPFYFVSLNIAGFLSFVRFAYGSQPPMWKKADRVVVPQPLYAPGEKLYAPAEKEKS